MRKFIAKAMAVVCAATMMFSVATAEKVISTTIEDANLSKAGDSLDLGTAGVDVSKVASFTFTFKVADESAGFGGGIIVNTGAKDSAGEIIEATKDWNQKEWGNEGKEYTAVKVSDGVYSVTRDDLSAENFNVVGGDSAEVWNQVVLSSWWGSDLDIIKVEVKDADGKALYTAEVKAAEPTAEPTKEAAKDDKTPEATKAPTTDKTPSQTGDATNVLALAAIACVALAGVAVSSKKRA